MMNTEELARQLIALPLSDRVDLAQLLWESIDSSPSGPGSENQESLISQAERRDAELTSGEVVGRSHSQVMDAARRVLGCN